MNGSIISIKPEDIAKLVDEKLQARLRGIEENENLDKVKKELMKHWGNDYQAKLKIAAQQLEVPRHSLITQVRPIQMHYYVS